MQNSVWLSEEVLKIAVKGKEVKRKGEKERYTHLNAEFQEQQGEIRKPSSVISARKIEENNQMGKARDLFKKLEIPREHFMQRGAQ